VETNEAFMAQYGRGDAAGIAALYTQDGQILPPNSDFVTGRPAIRAFWQELMDMGISEVKLDTIEVGGCSDAAFEVVIYTLYHDKGQTFDQGKCIVIWKQEDGAWTQHRDIYNSNMPESGA
jgi:uncharacterized protein (TIGR02246 family)